MAAPQVTPAASIRPHRKSRWGLFRFPREAVGGGFRRGSTDRLQSPRLDSSCGLTVVFGIGKMDA